MTWAVSPTQIADWRLCVRKFLWKYVVGLRPPAGPGAELGTEYHGVLENYLLGNTIAPRPEVWERLRLALPHFPQPGQCTAEEKFRFVFQGVEWQGKIDAFDGTTHDLKTTKARKWIKTEVELSCDPQALVYSWAKKTTRVKFVYVLTEGKPAVVVRETDVVGPGPVWDLLVEDARAILDAIQQQYHPLKVEPGPPSACEAFGGCPFRDRCTDLHFRGLGPERATPGLIQLGRKQEDMGMKEIQAKLAQSVAASQQSPADAAIAPGVVITNVTPDPDRLATAVTSAVNPPESAEAGPPPLPPPPKVAAAPKGRGRKKVQEEAPAAKPQAAEPESTPATDAPPVTMTRRALLIRTLYVNCASDGHPETVDLSTIMAEAHAIVQEKCNVTTWYQLPFGDGKNAMAGVCMELLKALPANAAGTLRIKCSSYLPETALVLGELQAAAAEVVR